MNEMEQEAEILTALASGVNKLAMFKELDINPNSGYAYLNATRRMSLEFGQKVANYLGIPLAQFSPRLEKEAQAVLAARTNYVAPVKIVTPDYSADTLEAIELLEGMTPRQRKLAVIALYDMVESKPASSIKTESIEAKPDYSRRMTDNQAAQIVNMQFGKTPEMYADIGKQAISAKQTLKPALQQHPTQRKPKK